MEKPRKVESFDPIRDGRRSLSYPTSPEFEFWMVRNPSLPQPNMHSADELFVDGVILPLDLVPATSTTVESLSADVAVGPELTAASASVSVTSEPVTGSRRWKDIFKKANKEETDQKIEDSTTTKMSKKKKRERKLSNGGGGGASSAELNINIWPFSRSRSAGTNGTRPKIVTGGRKVSSAPCSRSNSGGELSKSRKWPASPARPGGVHVGRSSPVWQVRRGGGGGAALIPKPSTPSEAAECQKGKTLKSCKQGSVAAYGGDLGGRGCGRKGSGGSEDGSGVVNLFSLRSLFSKRVY